MGKPFQKELGNISSTLKWAFGASIIIPLERIIDSLKDFPLFVVGSGGSLTSAKFVARLHEQVAGKIARALTPLEFLFLEVNPCKHAVLFVTAGGNNKDIINAFDCALKQEYASISVFCSTSHSKIVNKARAHHYVQSFEYSNPSGKDGFLAVNTLLSTCVLFAKAYKAINESDSDSIQSIMELKPDFRTEEWASILRRNTLVALGGEWAWPALVDLESKFTEAGLGNVLISDLKNFGHGRHNWFDKKGKESALVILETPSLISIAKRTLAILPSIYPRAVIRTSFNGPLATIDLLTQLFHFVHLAGIHHQIDPGRPHVPEFGRRMYQLSAAPSKKFTTRGAWVARKARVANHPRSSVEKALDDFLAPFKNDGFSGVVFDYDGTLCDASERFTQPKPEIASALNDLLSNKILIGIATGRGGSVQESLQKIIAKDYWGKVIVGNYNGSIILNGLDKSPNEAVKPCIAIQAACTILFDKKELFADLNIKIKNNQISITSNTSIPGHIIYNRLLETLCRVKNIKIVQSSHSIDIVEADVSKIKVVQALRAVIPPNAQRILVIGDQGQCGGNDFEMLNLPYSLSVDKVSSSLVNCWNLSPIGKRGSDATLSIIKAMRVEEGAIYLNTDYLVKEAT